MTRIVSHKRDMSHTEKQFIKWSNYWLNEKDPEKKKVLLRNMMTQASHVQKERQREE